MLVAGAVISTDRHKVVRLFRCVRGSDLCAGHRFENLIAAASHTTRRSATMARSEEIARSSDSYPPVFIQLSLLDAALNEARGSNGARRLAKGASRTLSATSQNACLLGLELGLGEDPCRLQLA